MKHSIWKYIGGTFYLRDNPLLRFLILVFLFIIVQDEVSGFNKYVANSTDAARVLFEIPLVTLHVLLAAAVYRGIWYVLKTSWNSEQGGSIFTNYGWCPYCTKKISKIAKKCPYCTADL